MCSGKTGIVEYRKTETYLLHEYRLKSNSEEKNPFTLTRRVAVRPGSNLNGIVINLVVANDM